MGTSPSPRRSTRFAVRVTPRTSRSEVTGFAADGTLRVRVTAPPVDGAANAALVDLLAGRLGVARSAVRVVGGATGRRKMIEVDGLDAVEVRARLLADAPHD